VTLFFSSLFFARDVRKIGIIFELKYKMVAAFLVLSMRACILTLWTGGAVVSFEDPWRCKLGRL
jgi:hypothetical protein